jgi:antitoxin ParD1/3/4
MQLHIPPDLDTLINKRLSSGGYTNVEDVLRCALEALDAEESWTDEERRALCAHIEEGYQQAERGELIDGAQARREIEAMKEAWRQERSSDACAFVAEAPMPGHSRLDVTACSVRFWTLTRHPNFGVVYLPDMVPVQIFAVLHSKRNNLCAARLVGGSLGAVRVLSSAVREKDVQIS